MEATHAGADALRNVMRQVPSPVTIVTAAGAGQLRGTTIGSFTSVSLDPPLVSFNVDRGSQMHDVLGAATRFAVHLPRREHTHLCTHFAAPDRPGADQFSTVPHDVDAHGTPILLEGAFAVLKCVMYDTVEAGDHSIIIGEVLEVDRRVGEQPVLYYRSTYRSVTQQAPAREERRCLSTTA